MFVLKIKKFLLLSRGRTEIFMLIYKIAVAVFAVIFGVTSFLSKKVLYAVTKNEPEEQQIIKFKFLMLILVIICAVLAVLGDYI